MATRTKPPVYRTYLLTAWQAPAQTKPTEAEWRFHLTDPHTGKRYGFTDAAALITALRQLAKDEPPVNEVE